MFNARRLRWIAAVSLRGEERSVCLITLLFSAGCCIFSHAIFRCLITTLLSSDGMRYFHAFSQPSSTVIVAVKAAATSQAAAARPRISRYQSIPHSPDVTSEKALICGAPTPHRVGTGQAARAESRVCRKQGVGSMGLAGIGCGQEGSP